MSEFWVGDHYRDTRLLLLGESSYSWEVDGKIQHPSHRHSKELVEWAIDSFPQNRLINMLSRALSDEYWPSQERLNYVWQRVAFTNYIVGTVGDGARTRPSDQHWQQAKSQFVYLLESICPTPKHVFVLGYQMWNEMPTAPITISENSKAYPLSDGTVCSCLRLRHPAGGLGWETLGGLLYSLIGNQLMA